MTNDPTLNRCPNCGLILAVCECTEDDMNRWAHEVLYGDQEREIERQRREEYEREYEAWWLRHGDDDAPYYSGDSADNEEVGR